MIWFRVFGLSDIPPDPAGLEEHLRQAWPGLAGHFKGDDAGWFKVDLVLPGREKPLQLDSYQASEDEIREQLNSWAAWLESVVENRYTQRLMQHLIGTQQVFTIECDRDEAEEEDDLGSLCIALCQYLASQTKGVYQVDGRGFFSPNGQLLVEE